MQQDLQHTADYEHMLEFVDALIAKKYPSDSADAHINLRERVAEALENHIEDALVSQLTEEQQQRLNDLAEIDGDPSAAFLNFFIQSGIDFNQIVQQAMLDFANSFLAAESDDDFLGDSHATDGSLGGADE